MKRVLRYFVMALIVSLGAVIGSARAQGGYGLYILGKEVTPANCGDLSTLDTERIKVQSGGEFKYDRASNTLFMRGVTIAGEEKDGQIENKGLENLTIDFAAENVLKSVNRIGIVLRKVTTFRGDGELRVETTDEVGILLHADVTLTISAITVTVSAGSYGIKGNRGDLGEQLIIKNATVVVNRSEFAAIYRLHSLGMEGVQIIEPVGGKWIPNLHSIMEGKEKAKRVKIAPWVAVTGVTLDKETLAFAMGDAPQTLTATVLPDKATNKKVTWTSSDTKVATVKDGTVTPVGVGEAKITVTTENEGKTATCTVRVNPVKVTGVTLDKETLVFTIGDASQTLTATVLPDKATNKKVTWTSDKPEVATVDAYGTVTAVGVGDAKITVTTEDEGKTATCTVTVNPVKVTEVTLDKETLVFTIGDAPQTLTATVKPDKATNKKVTWTSDKPEVATVKDGTVTPVGVGEAKITVTTEDEGKTATCTVTVNPVKVTEVTLDKETLVFTIGDAAQTLTATVLPDKATNKKVTWTSDKPEVATVKDGTVTAVGVGTAKITVTTEDEGKTAECTVTVNPVKVTGVTLNKETLAFTMGDAPQPLTATVKPDNATNKKVTWTSSKPEVATVADGTVTAVGVGDAKITVTTEDEGKTATCTVTVNPVKVTGVTLNKETLEFTIGDAPQTLTATVKPDKATNKKVTWTSSDTKVATVRDGTVTAVGVGDAKITVTTEDEGKTATCTVKVKAKPTPTPSPTPKPNPTPTPKPKPNAVEDAALATVLVAPTPFSTQLRIVNPEGASVTYELVNLAGVVLRTGVLDGTETVVETADLVAGLYFVRLTGENGAQRGVRVVKH